MKYQFFNEEMISKNEIEELKKVANECRGDILLMTTNAKSGHPGGSMSSIDILTLLYKYANISKDNYCDDDRDRIIVSNGHISPAVYSILGRNNFFDVDDAITYFRKAGYPFEGHIDRKVPGVEWITGNLGQGISSAAGIALANKLQGKLAHTFVLMGDGEQQKGQIVETRRFISKYNLTNITVIIDYNELQISGSIHKVIPQDLKAEYESTGWEVLEVNGHDFQALYNALRYSTHLAAKPVVIIAKTIMGKGVSFMENDEKWHGQTLPENDLEIALKELKIDRKLSTYRAKREEKKEFSFKLCDFYSNTKFDVNGSLLYESKTDNRSAFGNALFDIAQKNPKKVVVFDCDLAGSVKTNKFASDFEDYFIQNGIQEHSTASISAGCSTSSLLTFWADFGVFAADEVFNQLRLNEINHTNLKIAATHLGLNVGEDGKTHHAINYVALLNNLYDFKLILPADPNQTDRAVRFAAKELGNFFIGMGRAKLEPVKKEDGTLFFDENYKYEYGKADILRDGDDITLFTYGNMVPYAMEIYNILNKKGIGVRIVNISSPLKLDEDAIRESLKTKLFITYEDHNVKNGLGAILSSYLIDNGISKKVLKFGVTEYAKSGIADEVYKFAGLAPEDVAKKIEESL